MMEPRSLCDLRLERQRDMGKQMKILIVEDEMLLAADLSMHMENLGYEVKEMLPSGQEALDYLEDNEIDLMLVDIRLEGGLDGVAMVQQMQKTMQIPVIYLTSNTDDLTFNRAKETDPHAFLSKPFNKLDLQRAIELTIERINKGGEVSEASEGPLVPYVLTDSLFVKSKDSMVKVVIQDLLYIEAERSYCRIYAKGKEFLLSMPLKEMEDKLPPPHFLRVHRSFIVNLAHIEEVASAHVLVAGKTVPLTKDRRVELMKRLQTL